MIAVCTVRDMFTNPNGTAVHAHAGFATCRLVGSPVSVQPSCSSPTCIQAAS